MSLLQRARALIEARRGDPSLIGTALRAAELDRRRAGGLMAGGIAFRAFLWLLPSALLGVGILGLVRDVSHDRPEVVARKVGLSGVVGHSVGEAVHQSSRGTLVLIVLGAGLTVYLGMALVRAHARRVRDRLEPAARAAAQPATGRRAREPRPRDPAREQRARAGAARFRRSRVDPRHRRHRHRRAGWSGSASRCCCRTATRPRSRCCRGRSSWPSRCRCSRS